MAQSQRNDDPQYRYQRERNRIEDADLDDRDVDAILSFLSALDENDLTETYVNDKGEQESLAYTSLHDYGRGLRLLGESVDGSLVSAELAALNDVFTGWLEDLADQTVRQRQSAARKFYRYIDAGIDADEIPLTSLSDGSNVDDRNTLSKSDIQAMREVCPNLRDRAMLELFVYTGQRFRAVQTLRLKDIDLEEGVYYLNTEALGLKDAQKVGGKRPLLGAEKAVREWMANHPTGEDDDYLLTALKRSNRESGDMLGKIAIYNRLQQLFEESGVEKPEQQMAHAFRHYFVTIAYRDYGMDPADIKFLIGHKQDSTVMESTYQHLLDQDFVDRAREAAGMEREEEEEEEDGLTPEVCPTCQEPLGPRAKACPSCGMVFAPDAQAAEELVREGKQEADSLEEYGKDELVAELFRRNPDLLEDVEL